MIEAWVSSDEFKPDEQQVYLVFDNGLEISIWPEPIPPDFSQMAEAPFQLLTVRGNSGFGADPGVQQVEGYGEQSYTGSVTWWENGLVINIYGNFPLSKLQKVAESMPSPTWTSEN